MPSHLSPPDRMRVAELTRALYDGRVTLEDYVEQLCEVADPRLAELIALLEHEPERGGLHGVADHEYQSYRRRVTELIAQLTDDA